MDVVFAICCCFRRWTTRIYRSCAGVVTRGLLERGWSQTSSCCACQWTNLSTVLRWQLKCWATSLCVLPALIIPRAMRRRFIVTLGMLTWRRFNSSASLTVNDWKALPYLLTTQGFSRLNEFSDSPRVKEAFSQKCTTAVNLKAISTGKAIFMFKITY